MFHYPLHHMLTILIILASIITIWLATKTAWKYHVTQLRLEREKRNQNYHVAVALREALEVAVFGRDYYRAALIEISRISDSSEPAGDIARRFLASDDPRSQT